jgi:general secretion pathway protein A
MEAVAKRIFTAPDYCEHFQLERMPFNDSVNPEFFYRTESHEAAFVRMMMCAKHHKAIGLVWGRSGTGKTLLAQMLLSTLSEDDFIPVLLLANPGMSKTGLLTSLMNELQLPVSNARAGIQPLLDQLHGFLMQTYSTGKRVVIIVDEAHFLPADQLHMIRTLTNLETPQEKLCTIILFAEETFLRRLRHKRYNSLRGRIAVTSYLMPMSRAETEQYIKFRLMMAGAATDCFHDRSYELIYAHTCGVCREVSKIADTALMETYLMGLRLVTPEIVQKCINESI